MELPMDRALIRLVQWALCAVVSLMVRQSSAMPARHVFALIITNNKSVSLAQPDLQYADDDGARYYQLLRSIAAEPDVVLLTTFDRATAAIYPDLAHQTRAPTRAQVQLASKALGDAATQAHARGESTSFYLIFAGHGDIDEGKGYLELEDGRIDGRFIEEQILNRVPADAKHLVLDSCNSFFVVNPRKPGGRRWATPKDMALGFSARHPDVGLFLSTNSDSEVFEWSAIESGVFSHEVRSGLTGAADVNGDGSISYAELAGFIQVANAGIAREVLRPQLFYRGPRGDANAPLFPASQINGRHLTLAKPASRLWIKTAAGERVLDLHKEPGVMNLVIPGASDQELFVYEQTQDPLRQHAPTVLERRIAPGQGAVQLALLEGQPPAVAQRGDRLFGSLFAKPYGPLAYAQYLQTSAEAPEPVYGLTQADLARMHNYLSAMADQDRSTRLGFGIGTIGLGALVTSVGVGVALDKEDRRHYPAAIGIAGGIGIGLIGGGLHLALSPSHGEQALFAFEQDLARSKGNGSWAFVRTEEWLTKMAARERAIRNTWFWAFEGLGLALGTLATLNVIYPDPKVDNHAIGPAMLYTEAAYFMVCGLLIRSQTTPTERMLNLYHQDPAIKLHLGAVATPGGGAISVFGLF
jgi:hypothetical protein